MGAMGFWALRWREWGRSPIAYIKREPHPGSAAMVARPPALAMRVAVAGLLRSGGAGGESANGAGLRPTQPAALAQSTWAREQSRSAPYPVYRVYPVYRLNLRQSVHKWTLGRSVVRTPHFCV